MGVEHDTGLAAIDDDLFMPAGEKEQEAETSESGAAGAGTPPSRQAGGRGKEPMVPAYTARDVQASSSRLVVSPWLRPRTDASWIPRPAMTPFHIFLREFMGAGREGNHLIHTMSKYHIYDDLPAKTKARYEELSWLDEIRFQEETELYEERCKQRSLLNKIRIEERKSSGIELARSIGAELADLDFGFRGTAAAATSGKQATEKSDKRAAAEKELQDLEAIDGWALT